MDMQATKRSFRISAFLPAPQVVRDFVAHNLPAMILHWDQDAPGVADRIWHLPGHLTVRGPAPERFGVSVVRQSQDAYQVRVVWNEMCLSWDGLTRRQILASAVASILEALGTDVTGLLDQPMLDKAPLALAS